MRIHSFVRWFAVGTAAAAGVFAAVTASAQAVKERLPATVRVAVTDSAGVPVAGAEVKLVRGLREVLATGTTTVAGEYEFRLVLDSTDYSVTARKIGYARGDFFVNAEQAVVSAPIRMKKLAGTLPAVQVTAQDLRRKSYFIDADEIAGSAKPLHDAIDILDRLRPDMILSRSGFRSARGQRASACPPLRNIWVNGKWIRSGFVIVNEAALMRAKGRANPIAPMGAGNLSILSGILPEHIAEMSYNDCFEARLEKVGMDNALFVVLKEGVAFAPSVGTFVVGDTALKRE